MSGGCVAKLDHEKCNGTDTVQVFEKDGEFTAFCFKCSTYIPNPYNDKEKPKAKTRLTKTPEEVAVELEEIGSLPSLDLEHRKLHSETLERYGVKVAVSEQDGATPTIAYYPHTRSGSIIGYQCKLIDPKKFWWLGDPNDVDLFGWEVAKVSASKTIFITEGADDALALYQVLEQRNKGTKYEGFLPAVVSIVHGVTGARKDIARQLEQIRAKFEKIVLVFDQDEAGKSAIQSVLNLIPDAFSAVLPSKDANACLIEGRANALATAVLFEAKVPKNSRIVSAASLYEAAKEPAQWGLSWPWPKLTDLTRGMREGETTYIGAGVKMGKGEVRNAITAHMIVEHDIPCLVVSPEEHNKGTVQRVLGKVAGRIFHDPKIEFDYAAYDDAATRVGNRLRMINLWQRLDWEHLKADIRMAANEGVRAVFIDPITNIVAGHASGEANTMLEEMAQELSMLAKDLHLYTFIFCHLKSPLTGPSHERGGDVLSNQFAGSRAMMRSCNTMLGLWGNKDPNLPEEVRNMRELIILEDREFGASGKVPLYWDSNTGLFNQVMEA